MANLLTANQSSLETDGSAWVASGSNTTYTRSNTRAYSGSWSAKMTAIAGGDYAKITTVNRANTVANTSYAFTCQLYADSASSYSYLLIDWYSAVGGYLSTTFNGTAVSLTQNDWTYVSHLVTSPSGSASAQLFVSAFANSPGNSFWADEMFIGPTASATPSATDSGSLNDSMNLELGRVLTDSGSLTDSATVQLLGSVDYDLSFVDSGALNDSVSFTRDVNLFFEDTGELRDTRQMDLPQESLSKFNERVTAAKNQAEYLKSLPWRSNYIYLQKNPPWRPKN